MKYFISELYPHATYTAGVLREDIETVLLQNDYIQLNVADNALGFGNKVNAYIGILRIVLLVPAASKVFFHFPVRSRAKRYLLRLLCVKRCCTIGYLHDFDGIRDEDEKLLEKELTQLQLFSVLIAQNKKMQQWIKERMPHKKILSVEMYDYLGATPFFGKRIKRNEVSFAGNPQKAAFLKLLPHIPQIHFFIYGTDDPSFFKSNCSPEGTINPKALPARLKGSFGLVWDGDSIATCSGGSGLYLRLNTSHKLALYILAGLPVIIWDEAAMALWVETNGIGFTTPSLRFVEQKIAALSDTAYNEMCSNQKRLQQKIAAGKYLEEVLAAL